MKDKCPHCRKLVEIAGYGEKKCPKCGGGIFITPDEHDKDIMHLIIDLKIAGFPVRGDLFIDATQIINILSSRFSLENLSPIFGNVLESLFSKK